MFIWFRVRGLGSNIGDIYKFEASEQGTQTDSHKFPERGPREREAGHKRSLKSDLALRV